MKIALIGSGNVATHLGMALYKAGHHILQVYSPTPGHAEKLAKRLTCEGVRDIHRIDSRADLYLLAIKDDEIKSFVKRFDPGNKVIAHTSGTISLKALRRFSHHGVFYPLQTFSQHRKVNLYHVPVCVEAGDASTKKLLLDLARSISGQVHTLTSDERKKIHVAAVFVNNFVNHLCVIAEDLMKKEHLPFEILKPLIRETAAKIQSESPAKIQTGPAVRGDKKVIQAHLAYLSRFPEYQKIYKAISESIRKNTDC